MKHNSLIKDFDKLTINSPLYKETYLKSLNILQDNLDQKTLKSYSMQFAKKHKIDTRVFGAMDDWVYTTFGKVAYLDSIGFPLTKESKTWLENKMSEIYTIAKQQIKENKKTVLTTSPVIEKSEVKLSDDDIVDKIVSLVVDDKLNKDRDAPVKLLVIEKIDTKRRSNIIDKLSHIFDSYNCETSELYKKMISEGTKRSTMIRRRNEFGRIVQQLKSI